MAVFFSSKATISTFGIMALAAIVQPVQAQGQQGTAIVNMWVDSDRFNIYRPTLLIEGDTISVNVAMSDGAGNRRTDVPVNFTLSDSTLAEAKITTWHDARVAHLGPMRGLLLRALKPGLLSVLIEAGSARDTVTLDIRTRVEGNCEGKIFDLRMPVGDIKRWRTESVGMPSCLRLNKSEAGQVYLLTVDYTPKELLFMSTQPASPFPDRVSYQILAFASRSAGARANSQSTHDQAVRPARNSTEREVAGAGSIVQGGAAHSGVSVGDTLRLAGLSGYTWPRGTKRDDRVIVTHLGQNLILAESVENFGGRLMRPDSTVSLPIPDSLYARLDSAFGYGKRQLDRVFGQPYKSTLLGKPESRLLVANFAMMPSSWGGAFGPSTTGDVSSYVMLDFWTVTHGRSVSPYYQNPEIIAPRLIAHELAHVRHQETYGMRGHAWFFEGFGAFVEDLAITAATLRNEHPPLLSNLPYTQGIRLTHGSAFSPDASIFYGYVNSSYFFDYITGQAAIKGITDTFVPVRELLASDGTEYSYDQIAMRLAGTNMDNLLWQSRAAILLDDREEGLPPWTQYPDVLAPIDKAPMMRPWTIRAGEAFSSITDMVRGGIQGYFIDATGNKTQQLIVLGIGGQPGMAVTVTRLK